MAVPRNSHGIAVHEGTIYVVGGTIEDGSVTRAAELFDPRTNSWSTVMSMRKEVAGVGVAMLGDFLYATGGRDAEGWPQSIVQRYNTKLNKWEFVTSLTTSRTRHSVVCCCSHLYAFGGYCSNDDLPLNTGECYDHVKDCWSAIAPMSHRRSDASVVSVHDKVFVMCGEDVSLSPVKLSFCEVYDPQSDTWAVIPPSLQPRSHAGTAAIQNHIFLLGGVNKNNRELRSVERYDTNECAWTAVANLPVGIEGFACCTITVPGELMPVLV